jgi:DUF4097 and DUF4098 domain-containing protein YvlB
MLLSLLPTVVFSLSATVLPVTRPAVAQGVSFDTTVAITAAHSLSLDLKTGGTVKITGGSDKVVRVRVTEDGRECADCRVELEQTSQGIQVRSRRSALDGRPAKLQFEIEVPAHFDLDVASAGGELQIEGVDGEIKGRTQSGALTLRRLSGAVDLQTMRGDITLRESYVSGRVHTLGGRVLLEDVTGTVDGSSASGKVTERRVTRPTTAG